MSYLIALTQKRYQIIPKHFLHMTTNQLKKALCDPASYCVCVCVSVNQVRITQLSGMCVLSWKDNAIHFSSFYATSCFSHSPSSLNSLFSHFLWFYSTFLMSIFILLH